MSLFPRLFAAARLARGRIRPETTLRRTSALLATLSLLPIGAASLTGCLGDERCSPTEDQQEERCILIPVDSTAPNDASSDDAGEAFMPTPADLVGEFAQTGTIINSDCTSVLSDGKPFGGTVVFAEAGESLTVSFSTFGSTFDGTVTIEESGEVTLAVSGSLLGNAISLAETIRFVNADEGSGEATLAVTPSGGSACGFTVPSTLTRN